MSLSRVLIVDDQEPFRRSLRAILLSSPDWQVCGEAVDGIEAVEKAKLLQPNVVLMDVSMPRMNGLEATRIIQKELPQCSIVIVSQNDPEVVCSQAREVHACGFVIKSELPSDLIPALENLICHRRMNVESDSADGNGNSAAPSHLAGGGIAGQLIGDACWPETPPASLRTWPQNMKTSLSVIPTLMKEMIPDVTEHKQAEELTRQYRERFALVVQASKVGFWFCDLPFDKLNWDNRVKEHFWLPPEAEVNIDLFYERLHPDDRERTRQTIAESIANRTEYDIEYRTISREGSEKWIRAIGQTSYDATGQPIRFDGITLDISERKNANAALQRMTLEALAATAKFQAVFEQTSVFAGIMTTEGVLTAANRLCLEACGYREEEVIGKLLWNTGWWRLSSQSQEKIRIATAQAAQGVPYRETLAYHVADGSERLVDFSLHPIRDPAGKILFLHSTGVDITDLKSVEEKYRTLAETLEVQVRSRTEELEQRNREVLSQSQQLRQLSHSLMQLQDNERRYIARELHDSAGQILTALGMNLASVARQVQKISPQLAQEVEESQQMVQELTQEIRTTSYLLHPPLLDETGLCEALRVYTGGLKQRSDLNITLDVADDFGRLPREMELVIFRIVQECLTNIHRHSGSKVAIILLARKTHGVWLQIQDHGKGISPQRLVEIQLNGAGVGIRGIRERVLQFGGQMTVQSDSGGTKIGISLPLVKSEHSRTIGYVQQSSSAQADMQD